MDKPPLVVNKIFSPANCVLFLLAIVTLFFSDVLFFSKEKVLSAAGKDLYYEFVYFRYFGFQQLKQGNLALWNPHIFSGTPFLSGFQSALLYPLNVIFLILPLQKALNMSFVLHLFLAGVFMFFWTYRRGLSTLACLISSILFMFGGTLYLQIYAGHLPHICAMAWAPLVLLSIEGLDEKNYIAWELLGMFAVTMQILAGFPQHVFYTAITAGIYSCFFILKSNHRKRIVMGWIIIYLGASFLSAMQLFPGFLTASESVRGPGLSYKFASFFSFPPENLITLFSPNFFGNINHLQYWGQYYLWEMSVYIGVIGFIFSIYSLMIGKKDVRQYSLIMVCILFLLALGSRTPAFDVLFNYVPGFNLFRGSSKFIFYASMYLLMLTAIGIDHQLDRSNPPSRGILIFIFGMFLTLLALSIGIWTSSQHSGLNGFWACVLRTVQSSGNCYVSGSTYSNLNFIRSSGIFASFHLLTAACICFAVGLLLVLKNKYGAFSSIADYLIAFAAVLEILVFAKGFYSVFDISYIYSPGTEQISTTDKNTYRILNIYKPNSAMIQGMKDIWGYDAIVLRRYAELLAVTQGKSPNNASMYQEFSKYHKLFKMLRCRFIYTINNGKIVIQDHGETLPKASLIGNYRLIHNRDEILSAMTKTDYDPGKTVIFETPPSIEPVPSNNPGDVSIKEISTDQLIISAKLKNPAILFITENFSKGWRALSLPGSAQTSYTLMPANYIFQAIPLKPGQHHILLEYAPLHFRIGKWVTIFSSLGYLTFCAWYFRKKVRHRN